MGNGERYLIAKASADGNQADIWFVGASCPNGGGCGARGDFAVNAQRVLANKATGTFTFNQAESESVAEGMLFGDFYANTDGTHLYLEAAYGAGGDEGLTDVTGMTSAGDGAANCVRTSDLAPVGSTDCSTLGRSAMPSTFGLDAPMRNKHTTQWQADEQAKTAFLTALQVISDIDYSAEGVGKFEQ